MGTTNRKRGITLIVNLGIGPYGKTSVLIGPYGKTSVLFTFPGNNLTTKSLQKYGGGNIGFTPKRVVTGLK
jgi:hypothetical protein